MRRSESHTNEFTATHAIDIRWRNGKRRVIHVMLHDDGAAYTRAEWDADAAADWEVTDGEWRFQGSIPACESYTVTPFRGVRMSAYEFVQCDACDGAGELCTRCSNIPDNCGCDAPTYADEAFAPCEACGGTGRIEVCDVDDGEVP